jgi:hypothetical protein
VSLNTQSLPKGKRFLILHESLATLRAHGITPEVSRAKGSHFKIQWFDGKGRRRIICVALTSGEWRQSKNASRTLQRMLEGRV